MLKEESKKQLITRATQYGVDPAYQSYAATTVIFSPIGKRYSGARYSRLDLSSKRESNRQQLDRSSCSLIARMSAFFFFMPTSIC